MWEMSIPQHAFVNDREHSSIAIAGGYGSGKTDAGIGRALSLAWENPNKTVGFYTRTYDLLCVEIRPRFLSILQELGATFRLKERKYVIEIEGAARILFRSLEREDKIITYQTIDFIADELDTLKYSKAFELWEKMWGRNRQPTKDGRTNTGATTSTPEAFNFLYDRFVKKRTKSDRLIRATTYSNQAHLSDSYIENLYKNYPSSWIRAYVFGEFVNINTGNVYPYFDRKKNCTNIVLKGNEILHVGMDFNVLHMAAVIHIIIENKAYVVDEIYDLPDTPAMIEEILYRYSSHLENNKIFIYPDSSGKARSSVSALNSDFILLEKAKYKKRFAFSIIAPRSNPEIKSSVTIFNNCFCKKKYFINTDKAPFLTQCIEKQAYDKNGKPDKKKDEDHIIDAARYFAAYKFPIEERKTAPRSQPLHKFLKR